MDIDTDLAGTKKGVIMNALRDYYGQDNVLNCVTFKTETLKAAILTAMKGLGYSNDEANTLSNEVPVNRGHVYTLKECEEGDETLELDPAPKVVEHMKSYPNLYETIKKIEGLSLNASIHASAVYIFDNGYLEHNSLMRAPNGTRITAFDMNDTNAMSGLKIDLLFTDAETKLMKCVELLLTNHQIEWQGSLYATYCKYLHPDVLDYTTEQMWKNMSNGTYDNIFQWDTAEGAVAIKKAQPRSIIELATINSTIRVQSDGEVQPIDRYIAFKDNTQLWYDEMTKAGLNQHEIDIMKKYLLPAHGVSMQQEDFMRLVMDEEISGFSLAQANKLRKTIAHKQLAELKNQKDLFFSNAQKLGTSEAMQHYVWDYCIQPLAKYSFSIIHATVYSIVALQEVNLAYHYNPLYWACACLCVNAGNAESNYDDVDDDSDDDFQEETDDTAETIPTQSQKRATPDYGKIAKAISRAQHQGVEVALPDINKAEDDFVPDTEHNRILYSLTTVNAINTDMYEKIVAHRPYSSLNDFRQKNPEATVAQVIGLIKAGCFDELEKVSRTTIMKRYFISLSTTDVAIKEGKAVTLAQVKKAINTGLQLPEMQAEVFYLNFKNWITANQKSTDDPKRYHLTDHDAIQFFNMHFYSLMDASKGEMSVISSSEIAVKITALNRELDKVLLKMKNYFATTVGINRYLKHMRTVYCRQLWAKYCEGTEASWEMEQLSYYHGPHELANVRKSEYGIVDFNKLPEQPVPTGSYEKDGKTYNTYNVVSIAGTVVKVNSNKHIVSLLTTDGVVDVKMYLSMFNKYKEKISTGVGKDKVVLDEPWLKRGVKLLICGLRRDNMFTVKTKKIGNNRRDVCLIEGVNTDGSLELRFTRNRTRKESEDNVIE